MAAEEVSSSSSSVVITIFLESSLMLNWILFSSLAIIAALRLPWELLLILLLVLMADRVGDGFKMLLTFSLEDSTCPMILIGTLVDSSSEWIDSLPASDFRKDEPLPIKIQKQIFRAQNFFFSWVCLPFMKVNDKHKVRF